MPNLDEDEELEKSRLASVALMSGKTAMIDGNSGRDKQTLSAIPSSGMKQYGGLGLHQKQKIRRSTRTE